MIVHATWGGSNFAIDLADLREISVRLQFDGPQPEAFGIDRATATPYQVGSWIADTRQGGSVNCFVVNLCPHGNGTHTECVGHIVDERVAIADVLQDLLVPGWLATVQTTPLVQSGDTYLAESQGTDRVVSAKSLEQALRGCPEFATALVIRSLPNPASKAHAAFSGHDPTYLTSDAMRLIRSRGFKHLLVDFPSVDREDDGGTLPNHRIYWDVAPGSRQLTGPPSERTITEMIFVPDDIEDGLWCVALEVPSFALDAAPSRIRLARPSTHEKQ